MALHVTKNQTTRRRVVRRALDGALAALLALQMCYQLLADDLHALLGLAMTVLALAHLTLNAKGIQALGCGHVNPTRALLAAGACASTALMAILGVSGLVLSDLVPALRGFDPIARSAHLSGSYLALLAMSFHAGLHTPSPFGGKKGARSRVAPSSILWMLLACGGIYEFTALHILDYILLRMPFVLPATVPLPTYLLEHAAVMALFALLGSLAVRAAQAVGRKSRAHT